MLVPQKVLLMLLTSLNQLYHEANCNVSEQQLLKSTVNISKKMLRSNAGSGQSDVVAVKVVRRVVRTRFGIAAHIVPVKVILSVIRAGINTIS